MMKLSRLCVLSFGLVLVATAPASALAEIKSRNWTPAWYAAPEPAGTEAAASNMTLRQIVRMSEGGDTLRLRLSNAYGKTPLRLDDVHVARRIAGSRIDPATDSAVTFNGRNGAVIPPGAYMMSDPIALKTEAGSDLAVSVFTAGVAPLTTVHDIQRGVLYTAPGSLATAEHLPEEKTDIGIGNAFPWLAEVEVVAPRNRGVIVAFGDSITDGYGIPADSGGTWPDVLSARLRDAKIPLNVVNAGISGNRMLHHGTWVRFGEGGLSRFDRDVLMQPNVSAVVILLGINDLGHAGGPETPEYVSVRQVTDALSQMAARAHDRGLRVYAATLTPFRGTVFDGYYSDEKEERRQTINAWIRQAAVFDGVFDFDKALEDPAKPGWLLPAYDLGDHLHPNAAGAAVMAASVPLDVLKRARRR
jgi:lysophospholipase L1-like esterase